MREVNFPSDFPFHSVDFWQAFISRQSRKKVWLIIMESESVNKFSGYTYPYHVVRSFSQYVLKETLWNCFRLAKSLIEAIKIIFLNNFIFFRIAGFFVVQTSKKNSLLCDFTEQTRTRESQKSRKCYNRVGYDGNSKVNWNENRIVCRKAEISTCCFTCGLCCATSVCQDLSVGATRNNFKIH